MIGLQGLMVLDRLYPTKPSLQPAVTGNQSAVSRSDRLKVIDSASGAANYGPFAPVHTAGPNSQELYNLRYRRARGNSVSSRKRPEDDAFWGLEGARWVHLYSRQPR